MKKPIKITIAVLLLGIYLISMLNIASALTITSVNTNPSQISPGKTSTISIELENDGKYDIEDVSVILKLEDTLTSKLPFAPYDSSSEVSFDEIREDRTKYAEFEIIVLSDAKSGIYKIPLEINYKIDGEPQTPKNSLIGITVNSKPIIDVSVEYGLLLKGQENELTIKITNKGLADSKFVEISAGSSTYINILNSKDSYIGDIDSDDFDNVKFKVYFKENTPSSINFPVSIEYMDALNNKYTEDFNVQLKVYSRQKAIELGLLEKSKTPMYFGSVVAVIIIWIIYKKIKKRRKEKRAKQAQADFSV